MYKEFTGAILRQGQRLEDDEHANAMRMQSGGGKGKF